MTQLSKLATLGLAKETTPGTYVAPTQSIPFDKAEFEDQTATLQDTSYRGNDTTVQGLYPGPQQSTWSIDVNAYADLMGHLLRGTIGPDTVTAGATTTLSASTIVGATSIQTPVQLPAGTLVQIDTAANIEYALTDGAATGSGPYTSNITTVAGQVGTNRVGLTKAHASLVAVVGATTHTFKQNPAIAIPSYSLTVFDTTQTLGYTGAKFTDLQIKIDPKATVTASVNLIGNVGTTQNPVTETYAQGSPMLGWAWNTTNAGATSTRGLTYDLSVKRAGEAIHSSNGAAGPREIFVGTLDADVNYTAIFESQTDLNLFTQYAQQPMTVTASQPVALGGQSLALTMSKSGWTTGKRDLGQNYAQASFSISGVYNTTDAGAVQAVLINWQTAAY